MALTGTDLFIVSRGGANFKVTGAEITTFIGGVTSVTGTLPIVIAGSAAVPDITINAATTTTKGSIQIATLAEAVTGTLATSALTPESGVPKNASGMTGAAILPGGTSGTRPAGATTGWLRYDTDQVNEATIPQDFVEYYDAQTGTWQQFTTWSQVKYASIEVQEGTASGVQFNMPQDPAFQFGPSVVIPAGYTKFYVTSTASVRYGYNTTTGIASCRMYTFEISTNTQVGASLISPTNLADLERMQNNLATTGVFTGVATNSYTFRTAFNKVNTLGGPSGAVEVSNIYTSVLAWRPL